MQLRNEPDYNPLEDIVFGQTKTKKPLEIQFFDQKKKLETLSIYSFEWTKL